MQYQGRIWENDAGTVFFGTGEQRGRPHYLAQFTGHRAQTAWDAYDGLVAYDLVRVTRLDVALTVPLPPGWRQDYLFASLKADDGPRSVSYIESQSGPEGHETLATVYIGSRSSDRYVRVYEKPDSEGNLYLRFEVEYKGARAAKAAEIIAFDAAPGALVKGELEAVAQFGTMDLLDLFGPHCHTESRSATVAKPDSNTVYWLLTTCLASLERVLRADDVHPQDKELLRAKYLDAVTKPF